MKAKNPNSEMNDLSKRAKAMAILLFRNTYLEDIHTKYNFSDKDMKKLMIEVINRTFTFLQIQQNDPDGANSRLMLEYKLYVEPHKEWAKPKTVRLT